MTPAEKVIEKKIQSLAGLVPAEKLAKSIIERLEVEGYTIVINDGRKQFFHSTGL